MPLHLPPSNRPDAEGVSSSVADMGSPSSTTGKGDGMDEATRARRRANASRHRARRKETDHATKDQVIQHYSTLRRARQWLTGAALAEYEALVEARMRYVRDSLLLRTLRLERQQQQQQQQQQDQQPQGYQQELHHSQQAPEPDQQAPSQRHAADAQQGRWGGSERELTQRGGRPSPADLAAAVPDEVLADLQRRMEAARPGLARLRQLAHDLAVRAGALTKEGYVLVSRSQLYGEHSRLPRQQPPSKQPGKDTALQRSAQQQQQQKRQKKNRSHTNSPPPPDASAASPSPQHGLKDGQRNAAANPTPAAADAAAMRKHGRPRRYHRVDDVRGSTLPGRSGGGKAGGGGSAVGQSVGGGGDGGGGKQRSPQKGNIIQRYTSMRTARQKLAHDPAALADFAALKRDQLAYRRYRELAAEISSRASALPLDELKSSGSDNISGAGSGGGGDGGSSGGRSSSSSGAGVDENSGGTGTTKIPAILAAELARCRRSIVRLRMLAREWAVADGALPPDTQLGQYIGYDVDFAAAEEEIGDNVSGGDDLEDARHHGQQSGGVVLPGATKEEEEEVRKDPGVGSEDVFHSASNGGVDGTTRESRASSHSRFSPGPSAFMDMQRLVGGGAAAAGLQQGRRGVKQRAPQGAEGSLQNVVTAAARSARDAVMRGAVSQLPWTAGRRSSSSRRGRPFPSQGIFSPAVRTRPSFSLPATVP